MGNAKDVYLPLSAQPPPQPKKDLPRRLLVFLASSLLISSLWFFSNDLRVKVQSSNLAPAHHRRPLFGKAAENVFLSVPNAQSAIQASRALATKPHMAGTPGDLATAKEFLYLLQRELGIPAPNEEPIYPAGCPESRHATLSISRTDAARAWIDTYYPVMNTPLNRSLQIVDEQGTLVWEANLVEISDETDPDAGQYFDDIPTFHGLSRGGDVTGKIIDGNYCSKEDYDDLLRRNVDLKGSIIMCRYGGNFRGLKVKGGQELGAIGVLIYSDPRDDGTVTVENGYLPYPHGPARNPTSVQRGSVQYLSVYPGDPTTPGYPSYENSTRTDGSNIPLIPSLPISWSNAEVLFRTINKGDVWEGKRIRLVNNVDTRVIPVWNVMGVIPGYLKNEVVVVGNHRDAWVMGATDPSSGTTSVHEVVRGLGRLLRLGWKPLRTILIASWDAEEYGLIGSTEWGEDFPDWIDQHVVAYLNLDSSVSGSRFRMSGSPLLAHFIRDTAKEIPHPTDSTRNLWGATTDDGVLFGLNVTLPGNAEGASDSQFLTVDDVGVSPLGSGSDYTVFLQRSGIPSTNGGFGSTIHDPVYHYHSVFDSERWQELYGDPGFSRHVAVAKHLGLQTLRLASQPILPYNTTHYAYELEKYLNTVQAIASQTSLDVQFRSLRKSIHDLQDASIALDRERHSAQKELEGLIQKWKRRSKHQHDLISLATWVSCKFQRMTGKGCVCPRQRRSGNQEVGQHLDYDEYVRGLSFHSGIKETIPKHGHKHMLKRLRKLAKRIRSVNQKAIAFEKGFISEEGIKDREWYRHLAVAPGKWLGYGATTLPGLTESITFENNGTLAQHETDRLQNLVHKLTKKIKV